jgi:hypothetical protein
VVELDAEDHAKPQDQKGGNYREESVLFDINDFSLRATEIHIVIPVSHPEPLIAS